MDAQAVLVSHLALKMAARAVLLRHVALEIAAQVLLLRHFTLKNSVRRGCSKKLCSVTLYSVPLSSASLCSVHGYARVHTSIYLYLNFPSVLGGFGGLEMLQGFVATWRSKTLLFPAYMHL